LKTIFGSATSRKSATQARIKIINYVDIARDIPLRQLDPAKA
jgi:hypothetical protein